MPPGRASEVLAVFLRLGLTSFGGPVAHLGYFREAVVVRRRWLGEADYADLVALCSALPGPTSSQVGFALGLRRAGWLGAAAAFLGFTAPSAAVMGLLAFGSGASDPARLAPLIHALQVGAVAVVAHAVLGMARTLAATTTTQAMALCAFTIVLLFPGAWGQMLALVMGAVGGALLLRSSPPQVSIHQPGGLALSLAAGSAFLSLLVGLPVLTSGAGGALRLVEALYRSGALVFGGGHVVLPLLGANLADAGLASREQILAGYGAVQAMPGPLFTVASFIGFLAPAGPGGGVGALLGVLAIFLPGFLVLLWALPLWAVIRSRPAARGALAGLNAAVTGLLGAALYDPVWRTAVLAPGDVLAVVLGFTMLAVWRWPPWSAVVTAVIVTGVAPTMAG